MKRWLPHPLMAGFLLLVWLLLGQSLAPGRILVGLVLALLLARAFGRLQPPPVRVRHIGRMAALLVRVIADITRSNMAVARIITMRRRRFTSGFVTIPLVISHPYALTVLACIITATPGTIWVRHDSTRRLLIIHVLDLIDETAWIAMIRQRYEVPLQEIFQ